MMVATRLPGHDRPLVIKHLTCQPAAVREHPGNLRQVHPEPLLITYQRPGVRHSSAAVPADEHRILSANGGIPLDSAAAGVRHLLQIKHAPNARNDCSRYAVNPATFQLAQALLTQGLPHRMHIRECLRISQNMIFF
jgi:hypothetical protein